MIYLGVAAGFFLLGYMIGTYGHKAECRLRHACGLPSCEDDHGSF